MKYDSINDVLSALETVQGNEQDERNKARECTTFLYEKDGQWEKKIYQNWGAMGRPRYTYDRITPIVDSIVGELEQNEFAADVTPGDSQSSKDNAKIIDGMLRSIQNWSDASFIYKKIARKLAVNGFDCCRVVSDYRKPDSFDQDIIIKYISNSIDRVWFDPSSEKQDRSDAEYCYVLQSLTPDQYDDRWPKGSGIGVSSSRNYDTKQNKRETISVGEFLYKKRTKKTIVQMNNGAVYNKEEVEPVIDELKEQGITIAKEREVDDVKVYSRIFDGQDWLEDEKPTPFSKLPIVPFYHCFEVIEDKLTWRRIIERLMDAQRILNYAVSKKIEEGALAPRKKIVMTHEHAKGKITQGQIAKLNTSPDPVLFINNDKDAGWTPYELGGAQMNPGLQETAAEAAGQIEAGLGMYAANLAKNPGVQSGVAIELQQNKGDTGNSSFYVDMAKGITYLCEVIVDALPSVYDTRREVLLLNPDGSSEMTALNDVIRDEETQQLVTVNDLNGQYGVICSMGAMFRNRAEKANSALLEVGKVAPEAFNDNLDTFLRNFDAPGMDAAADRIRRQLFEMGKIPQDQMTEEEKAELAKMQAQPPQPDAMMLAAQAEIMKAQADLQGQQNKQAELQIRAGELQLKGGKLQVDSAKAASDMQNQQADTAHTLADTQKKAIESEGVALDNALKQQELAEREMETRMPTLSTQELMQIVNYAYQQINCGCC